MQSKQYINPQHVTKIYPGLPVASQARAGNAQEDGGNFWDNLKSVYSNLFGAIGIQCTGGKNCNCGGNHGA